MRTGRIRYWTKNLLVFVVPAAAGEIATAAAIRSLLVTHVVFCLLDTGCYLGNDVCDAGEDRHHPIKRHRPVQSGALTAGGGIVAAAISIVLGPIWLLLLTAGT